MNGLHRYPRPARALREAQPRPLQHAEQLRREYRLRIARTIGLTIVMALVVAWGLSLLLGIGVP